MAIAPKVRHLRHRLYSHLRKARARLEAFLLAVSTTLNGTATGVTFTASSSTDAATASSHPFVTGKGPIEVSQSGGALPAGLVASTDYWPIKVDADTFKFATSRQSAFAGSAIDLTTNGSGTLTAKYRTTQSAVLDRLRAGTTVAALGTATDIDAL